MGQFDNIEKPIIEALTNPEGAKVPIEFVTRSIQNKSETIKQGRPVFEEKVHIRHYISRLNIFEREVKEEDFHKYAAQYEAFKNNKKQKEAGIPVGLLPAITKTEVDNLEACRVYTIERLASAPEIILSQIGGGARGLQQKAQAYLQQSSSAEVELKTQRERIAELEKQLAEVKNESSNDSPKRSKRVATVSVADTGNREQQQGSVASPKLPE